MTLYSGGPEMTVNPPPHGKGPHEVPAGPPPHGHHPHKPPGRQPPPHKPPAPRPPGVNVPDAISAWVAMQTAAEQSYGGWLAYALGQVSQQSQGNADNLLAVVQDATATLDDEVATAANDAERASADRRWHAAVDRAVTTYAVTQDAIFDRFDTANAPQEATWNAIRQEGDAQVALLRKTPIPPLTETQQ